MLNKMDSIPIVVPLASLTREDVIFAGAKAANLGEMIRAGLPVPPGFCLTTRAYQQWIKANGAAHTQLEKLGQCVSLPPDKIQQTAAQLRQALDAVPVPDLVQSAVRLAVLTDGVGSIWAVRSSATVEDMPGASFAGQYDSFLNVRDLDILFDKVRQCWISLFSDRAVIYRLKHHISLHDAGMAVIVQRMVLAEVSGVLFTAHPVEGNTGHILIEGVRGLGEALVGGKASPDQVVLDKSTRTILTQTVNQQATAIVTNESGGVCMQTVTESARAVSCLDLPLLRRLGELAIKTEDLFKGAQDIEWAAHGNEVFLLQSRPITTPIRAAETEPEIWTNANATEAFPEVVTPMAWSVMQILLEEFLHPIMRRLGVELKGRPLVGLIAGRAYLNLRPVAEVAQRVGGSIPIDFASAFGGQTTMPWNAKPKAWYNHWIVFIFKSLPRLCRLIVWMPLGLLRQQHLIASWGPNAIGEAAHISPADLSDEQLADYPRRLIRRACAGAGECTWAAAVWMAVGAVGGCHAVFRLTHRWLGDAGGSLANRLIAGAGNMNSAENGLELLRLADWIRGQPELRTAVLASTSFAQLERQLADLTQGVEFNDRWQAFMQHHGHQARGGMDVAQPRWSEMPDFVFDMLRGFLHFSDEENPLTRQLQRRRERPELLASCRQRLRNPFKWWLLGFFLRFGQRGLAQRENVKNDGVRMIAIMRRILLEAGRRLVERGVLKETQDVFYLHMDELSPLLSGQPGCEMGTTIAARKAEHADHQTLSPPPLVVGQYDPGASIANAPTENIQTLQGVGVSPGVVHGKARVILQADADARILPGEILVAPYTDPGWTPYFLSAAAVVVDVGGLLSHGSVVAREYGLPAVVNASSATRIIKTGQMVCVDGNRGIVTIYRGSDDPLAIR